MIDLFIFCEMHNIIDFHYNDVIMSTMASQITSLTVVYSTVLFRHRSKKTSKLCVTGLCEGNSPWPVNSPHKGPVTRKMFPFHDVIMGCVIGCIQLTLTLTDPTGYTTQILLPHCHTMGSTLMLYSHLDYTMKPSVNCNIKTIFQTRCVDTDYKDTVINLFLQEHVGNV